MCFVSFSKFLKSWRDDMIIENKKWWNTIPQWPRRGPKIRVVLYWWIWFTAFFYKHVTTFRVINSHKKGELISYNLLVLFHKQAKFYLFYCIVYMRIFGKTTSKFLINLNDSENLSHLYKNNFMLFNYFLNTEITLLLKVTISIVNNPPKTP